MLAISARVSSLALASGLSVCLVSCASMEGVPSAVVQGATQPASIPLQPIVIPPHAPLRAGGNTGSHGSVNVNWQYPGAPHDGVDAIAVP